MAFKRIFRSANGPVELVGIIATREFTDITDPVEATVIIGTDGMTE